MKTKAIVSLLLTACWILSLQWGYDANTYHPSPVTHHALYMVSHANAWHLAANLFVLWLLREPLHLWPSVAVAFVASWFPSVPGIWELASVTQTGTVTMGFSGVLFAIIGCKWGKYWFFETGRWPLDPLYGVRHPLRDFVFKVMPWALLGFIIPHVNWCLHLYCLLLGFIWGAAVGYLPLVLKR